MYIDIYIYIFFNDILYFINNNEIIKINIIYETSLINFNMKINNPYISINLER